MLKSASVPVSCWPGAWSDQRQRPWHQAAAAALCLLCLASQLGPAEAAAPEGGAAPLNGSAPFRIPRVAVIGAGIGGASTAYFLNKLFDGHVTIHV